MSDAGIANMFEDLSFDLVVPTRPQEKKAGASSSPSRPAEAEMQVQTMQTPRDMLGDLDSMLETLEERPKWAPKFQVGQEVTAMYTEDELWYVAQIDEVDVEAERYVLTFTEYGNSQVTAEEDIRPTLASMMVEREKELAPAVEKERSLQRQRRNSYILANPPKLKQVSLSQDNAKKEETTSVVEEEEEEEDEEAKEAKMIEALMKKDSLTPEERKMLVLAQARKLTASSNGAAPLERTFITVSQPSSPSTLEKANSDRTMIKPRRKSIVGRARSSSVAEIRTKDQIRTPPSPVQQGGISGDMDLLLHARPRAESESAVAVKTERKVWADNLLVRKPL